MLLYLRACLACSAGLTPDMDGIAAMKDQAPMISKYVKSLLEGSRQDNGPVKVYIDLILSLLKAVGGKQSDFTHLNIV